MAEVKIDSPISKKEGGLLVRLWRKIIHDLNYDRHLDYLVTRYVAKTDKMHGRVQNVRRKTKSSLIKNISSSEMTFKTFLDLLFNYVGVRKLDISVKMSFHNGEERITSLTVINSDLDSDWEEDDAMADNKSKSNSKKENTKKETDESGK